MTYRRIVFKLGTTTLTGGTKKISPPRLVDLARQVSQLSHQKVQVVLVSSGAMAAGREVLGYPDLPGFIPAKQMLAAVGQPRLMALYEQYFAIYGCLVGQVLLTREDISSRVRYLNSRNTLEALLNQGVIPIVNENDTVATEEIRFGDNDNLSARVANLVEADLLVLLTDQEGLFTDDPRRNPAATLVREVTTPDIPAELWQAAGGSANGLGTGGMFTKLQAADLARQGGTTVLIAWGGADDVILRAAASQMTGTRFAPLVDKLEARKRYILAGGRPSGSGTLHIDSGALKALRKGGSLLPVGITGVEGNFERGDTVRVVAADGREVALGLASYPSVDVERLFGRKSGEIEGLLGYNNGDEVIHRDSLVLLGGTP
jgi:glutamate 5-kinase